eukprot:gene7571-8411_t
MMERLKLLGQEKRDDKTAFHATIYASLWQHIGCPPEPFWSYVLALLGDRDYEKVVEAIGKVDKEDPGHINPANPQFILTPHPPRPGLYFVPDRQQEGRRQRCFICNATGHIAVCCFKRERFNADGGRPQRSNEGQ